MLVSMAAVASLSASDLREAIVRLPVPNVVSAILLQIVLGLPTEVPAPRPARAPPLCASTPDQAGWDDDSSVFAPGC